jgi:hypothetical protein
MVVLGVASARWFRDFSQAENWEETRMLIVVFGPGAAISGRMPVVASCAILFDVHPSWASILA